MPDDRPELDSRTAVLLIAHGSRRAEANQDLVRLSELVAERRRYLAVELAYLEIAEPTIREGAARCVAQGAVRVLMLPYFLSAGAHVVEDLESHRRLLSAAHPNVEFALCPPLGLHPLLVDVVLARLDEGEPSASK
jgi:sirohydrochlorin ferrochelatase